MSAAGSLRRLPCVWRDTSIRTLSFGSICRTSTIWRCPNVRERFPRSSAKYILHHRRPPECCLSRKVKSENCGVLQSLRRLPPQVSECNKGKQWHAQGNDLRTFLSEFASAWPYHQPSRVR